MNFAICRNCGTKFSTRFVKGVPRFCTEKCKVDYRAKTKHLPAVLRLNVVPCPDCGEPMHLEKSGHYGHLRLACDTEDCEVIWIEGFRVIRSGLTRKRASPSEVQYLINMLSLPQDLYSSIRIIDFRPMARTARGMPMSRLRKKHFLTPVQETNLLCTLVDQLDFDLEKHDILIPVITWAERRKNLIKKEHPKPKFRDMHTEAGVTIMLTDDEAVGEKFLCFSKSVRVMELTREERVKLAAMLLEDFLENLADEVKLDKSRVCRVLGVRNTVPSKTCTS